VPADLASALPALPPNDGVVTLRLLAGDGQTPVPTFLAELPEPQPHYGHPLWTTAANPYSSDGRFNAGRERDRPSPARALRPEGAGLDFGAVYATAGGDFPSSGVVELSAVEGRTLMASSSAASAFAPTKAFDFDLGTTWRAAATESLDTGHTPWLEVAFPPRSPSTA